MVRSAQWGTLVTQGLSIYCLHRPLPFFFLITRGMPLKYPSEKTPPLNNATRWRSLSTYQVQGDSRHTGYTLPHLLLPTSHVVDEDTASLQPLSVTCLRSHSWSVKETRFHLKSVDVEACILIIMLYKNRYIPIKI